MSILKKYFEDLIAVFERVAGVRRFTKFVLKTSEQ